MTGKAFFCILYLEIRLLFAVSDLCYYVIRFFELASALDPAKPPTSDKVAILNDATRRINQLQLEVQMLKESNSTLRESIKSVKVTMINMLS